MPLIVEPKHSGPSAELLTRAPLTIGLVNNMPDAAVEATERQFAELIRGASSEVAVRLKRFSIPEMPRAAPVQAEMATRYRDISELWETHVDGLIVTGTEPRADSLADEPYWPAFRRLLAWARDNTASTIWSCLAAHAAVLESDGIERRPFADKLFGVFDCETVFTHPLLRVARPPLAVPHSRFNDLPEPALAASGYDILTRSAVTGADAFVREERGGSLFVFFQGHPEYETGTLVREYRRDVARFLRGERDRFPTTPQNYFKGDAASLAETFRAGAINNPHEGLVADFPLDRLEAGVENTWRGAAVGIYRNWISYLKERKASPRALFGPPPSRRSRRALDRRRPALERSVAR